MKCQICKIKETRPGSIVCSDKCNEIRLRIYKLVEKYTPTNGCANCRGDLGQGCTEKCREEFRLGSEFSRELYSFVKLVLDIE